MAEFTAPFRMKQAGRNHYYVDATGQRMPGVTTILGDGLPKKALINWAAEATADWAVNNWERLSELPPAARLKELYGARYAVKDAAAKRGTEVHGYAERLAQGQEVKVPEVLVGYVEAYARFLEEFRVEPVLMERPIASYRYGYAGKFDLVAWLTDIEGVRELWSLDVKTTRSGIFGEVALQLAGYMGADVYQDENGQELPLPAVTRFGGVHVRADGYDVYPLNTEQLRPFLYVKEVAAWDAVSRELVGPALEHPTASMFRLTRET